MTSTDLIYVKKFFYALMRVLVVSGHFRSMHLKEKLKSETTMLSIPNKLPKLMLSIQLTGSNRQSRVIAKHLLVKLNLRKKDEFKNKGGRRWQHCM